MTVINDPDATNADADLFNKMVSVAIVTDDVQSY